MTDNEIIKALESEIHLAKYVDNNYCDCVNVSLLEATLDLINRQKAEIERLTAERAKLLKECKKCGRRTQKAIGKLQKKIKTAKAEAIKELAEIVVADYPEMEYYLDTLVKEMTEQRKEDEGK